jgi:hypothetical protein
MGKAIKVLKPELTQEEYRAIPLFTKPEAHKTISQHSATILANHDPVAALTSSERNKALNAFHKYAKDDGGSHGSKHSAASKGRNNNNNGSSHDDSSHDAEQPEEKKEEEEGHEHNEEVDEDGNPIDHGEQDEEESKYDDDEISQQQSYDNDALLDVTHIDVVFKALHLKLSKAVYLKCVDKTISHMHLDDATHVSEHEFMQIYKHAYAPAITFGSRFRIAAGRGDIEIVSELLERGCDMNSCDGRGHSALHHASFHGQTATIKFLSTYGGKDKKSQKLIVDVKDNNGWTPLHSASSNGCADTVKLLLDIHASASAENKEGRTALHVAAGKGQDTIVKMLLSKNHDLVNAKAGRRGWTPIFDACLHCHDETIRLLLKGGADVDVVDLLGKTCEQYCDEELWAKVMEPVSPRGGRK